MTATPSFWIRAKWAVFGKPVTHEEHRAATASDRARTGAVDQRVTAQQAMRNPGAWL